jgi:hypothetical protein
MDKNQMFPQEILDAMPALYSLDGKDSKDVKVHIKIFNPSGGGTWYLTEFDPESRIFFGLCNLGYGAELGNVSMDEILSVKCPPFGLGLERDLHCGEMTLQDAKDNEGYQF